MLENDADPDFFGIWYSTNVQYTFYFLTRCTNLKFLKWVDALTALYSMLECSKMSGKTCMFL